jgi:hypothetical protein
MTRRLVSPSPPLKAEIPLLHQLAIKRSQPLFDDERQYPFN